MLDRPFVYGLPDVTGTKVYVGNRSPQLSASPSGRKIADALASRFSSGLRCYDSYSFPHNPVPITLGEAGPKRKACRN